MEKHSFLNKLKLKRPEVFERYGYEKVPEIFDAATEKISIVCKEHGDFKQRAYEHLYGSNCPKCFVRKASTEDFIRRGRERFGARFDYSKTKYTGKENFLTVTCPDHGDFETKAVLHLVTKYGCPSCNLEKYRDRRRDSIFEAIKRVHGDRYDYSKVVFKTVNDLVEIGCRKHGSFFQKLYPHSLGVGCPKCSVEEDRISFEEFLRRAREVHGNVYDYDKDSYRSYSEYLTVICRKHGPFRQRAGSHLHGYRCRKCSSESNRLSQEAFIEEAKKIHGDRYDYSRVVYNGSKEKVILVCKDHGEFQIRPNNHLSNRTGCPRCKESRGETEVSLILDDLGLDYIREYQPRPWRYRFDFYLEQFNVFIEFHGKQHYEPVGIFGGESEYLRTLERDRKKEEIVKIRNGTLIVLSYEDQDEKRLKEVLVRKLKEIAPYWFRVGERIETYKELIEVLNAFGLPENTNESDLVAEVQKRVPEAQRLF